MGLVLFLAAAAPSRPPSPAGVPDLVFVSRRPLPRGAGVPGLGPDQRAAAPGGRLMLRRADGRVAPFLHGASFFDVSDPAVSYDGRRVAFAAVTRPDSGWRIWSCDAGGRDVRAVTRTPAAAVARSGVMPRRVHDLDPCWLPDGRICFASTRYPARGESGRDATNLYIVHADGRGLARITGERNGAEEPAVDPATGRLLFARWWTNRHRPSDVDAGGLTLDPARALPGERVGLWQALTMEPDGDHPRLAGGYPIERAELMAYQPVLLDDHSLVGVNADTLSLSPHPGRVRLAVYPGGFARPHEFPEAPAQMCSPVSLPDGRLVVSYDPAGRGDFGLAVVDAGGGGLVPLADLRGTLELDAAVLAPRATPPLRGAPVEGMARDAPATDRGEVEHSGATIRFDCLNVFANAPVDVPIPDAPAIARDVRIRFFASLARPGSAAGDTVVLLREAEVNRSGAIHEDHIPGDLPMFEQLVDAHGHVLQSVGGPAHVPGFNAGRPGTGTQCVGCHTGHTAIPVAESYALGKRFNAAPSATVTATSESPGTAARALVDRRTRGDAGDVAWIARTASGEAATLAWAFPLAVDSVVVYGIRPDAAKRTDLEVEGCELLMRRAGRTIARLRIDGPLSPDGRGIGCGGRLADSIELRPLVARGRVSGEARTGLAEVEARARIPED